MKASVCTLFEGDYHYGLGALVNSLYQNGYRGSVWVGYRGALPPWARPLNKKKGYKEYTFFENCSIRFVLVETDNHFTNYKPDFMLQLWNELCPDKDMLFYFDPDIVVKCRWSYYEEWAKYGVALCEDVNSPLPKSHPLRMAWREFYKSYNFILDSDVETYVNGGFIGVEKINKGFLHDWMKIQELMAPEVGGLRNTDVKDRTFLFNKTDQDALNIALMSTNLSSSLVGKEGMDFAQGGFTMSHAIGRGKPWKKKYWFDAIFRRKFPRLSDSEYWKYTQYPIKIYSCLELMIKYFDLNFAKLASRFIA